MKKGIDSSKETILTQAVLVRSDSELPNMQKVNAGKPIDNRKRLIYDNFRSQGYSVREASELAGYNASYARFLSSLKYPNSPISFVDIDVDQAYSCAYGDRYVCKTRTQYTYEHFDRKEELKVPIAWVGKRVGEWIAQ